MKRSRGSLDRQRIPDNIIDREEKLRARIEVLERLISTREAADTVVAAPPSLSNTLFSAATTFSFSDFYHNHADRNLPFIGVGSLGGGFTTPDSGKVAGNHPGVLKLRSSATPNSGCEFRAYTSGNEHVLIGGNEWFEMIFDIVTLTNSVFRFGYVDAQSITADPFDGVYFEVSSGTLKGKTANNQTVSTTATTYTPSTGVWYRARLGVNEDASLVSYYLYDENGAGLWSDTLSTNIPTATGRECGVTIRVGSTNSAITDLIHLDYAAFWSEGMAR